MKNNERAEKAGMEADRIARRTRALEVAQTEIKLSGDQPEHHTDVHKHLSWLKKRAPKDFEFLSQQNKKRLVALISNIQSLSKLVNVQVSSDDEDDTEPGD